MRSTCWTAPPSTAHTLLDEVARLTDGRGVNVAFDIVGGQAFADSLKAIGYAGRVLAMANVALAPSTIDTRDFYPKNVRIFGFQITALLEHGYDPRPDLTELLAGIAAGRFTVAIDATFPLAEAADAHRHLEQRSNRGKVLLSAGLIQCPTGSGSVTDRRDEPVGRTRTPGRTILTARTISSNADCCRLTSAPSSVASRSSSTAYQRLSIASVALPAASSANPGRPCRTAFAAKITAATSSWSASSGPSWPSMWFCGLR